MVAKLIRQGKLAGAWKKEGRVYRINPEKADAILATFDRKAGDHAPAPAVLPAAGKPAPGAFDNLPAGLISFAEACRREKLAKANLLEIRLRKERGELIERERVEAAAAKLATLVRIGVEAIPAKVAPTVAGMQSPGDVARLLQKQLRQVLNNLAEGITKMDF
jgi:hypothetical protein